MPAIMIQGTGSNTGKSLIVAGLCRAAKRRGIKVLPFKAQNMSNNAAVTADGGEIGRAQALQALSCGVAPTTDMNPVLLKPETETGAQVIVQGKRLTTVRARDYAALKPQLLHAVMQSFNRISAQSDLVIVEGAGSPAEINLRAGDIANMGFAQAADIPVILLGDIDRGGVIAQLVGTKAVLSPEDAARIKGFIINKFRGDPALFEDGYNLISSKTEWHGCGVVPWFADAHKLPAEDALDLRGSSENGAFKIACLVLSRIANFDDLDPLAQEPGVSLSMIRAGQALPGDIDLVILPGTKSTRGDLDFLRAQGWDVDLQAHVRRGGRILGLCGGYQMLGQEISDPGGIEGLPGSISGLGLLDVKTEMLPHKELSQVTGIHSATGKPISAYEIHIGRTSGPDCSRAFAQIDARDEGAISSDGKVTGTYLHGLFSNDSFRAAWLAQFNVSSALNYDQNVEATLDALAEHLEQNLDIEKLLALSS